jgi:hypothetical protein
MCCAFNVERVFFDDWFEFLVDPSSQSVCNTADCKCDWVRHLRCSVHLGGNVKVAVLVLDLEEVSKECAVIFSERLMLVP